MGRSKVDLARLCVIVGVMAGLWAQLRVAPFDYKGGCVVDSEIGVSR